MTASYSVVITETPLVTSNFTATSVAKVEGVSTTVANRGLGESSVLPTKSSASLVNQTASVSIAYSKNICTVKINNPGRS